MSTSELKKFAQAARKQLIAQVGSKMAFVQSEGSQAQREQPRAVEKLQEAIRQEGQSQIIEQVAYTWFNRFTALRFMDVNGYNQIRVVSPADGQTRPEILAEAAAGNLPDGASEEIVALLEQRSPSRDPQGEAYRLLLIHTCNQWHAPMPFLFEKIDDYAELLMPEDLLSNTSILAEIRKAMNDDACKDVEIIGWLYQFYISEKKDEVFDGLKNDSGLKKNKKIVPQDIPAATQLFTPHWIVRYLVENSLGRLWLLNRPESSLVKRMDYFITPVEFETNYPRISSPEEILICDPACGSGHMLTYAFDLLYAIYEEEGYDVTEIPALILENNLTGIEIDDRAGALAAFALKMKAASKLGRRRFSRLKIHPEIYVMENIVFTEEELNQIAELIDGHEENVDVDELNEALNQFKQAKNLGSLIVPELKNLGKYLKLVEALDIRDDIFMLDLKKNIISVLKKLLALSKKFHVVLTNPPYMGSKSMNDELHQYIKKMYPVCSADLFAPFIETGLSMTVKYGFVAMITMQTWMFLSSFKKLRNKLLSESTIVSMAHLGERAFDSIGGAIVSTTAFILKNDANRNYKGQYIRLIEGESESEKIKQFMNVLEVNTNEKIFRRSAESFSKIPGKPIVYWASNTIYRIFNNMIAMKEIASPKKGMTTGNNDRFLRFWYEISQNKFRHPNSKLKTEKWVPYNKGGEFRRWYGNLEYVVNWEDDGFEIKQFTIEKYPQLDWDNLGWKICNERNYFCEGLTWSGINSSSFGVRIMPEGMIFDSVGSAIFTENIEIVLAQLSSITTFELLQMLNPTLKVNNHNIEALPFPEIENTHETKKDVKQLIDLSVTDWNAYETSWDYITSPLLMLNQGGGQINSAYEQLRYHWKSMTEKMLELEVRNNKKYINAYGLEDELSPEVPAQEITLKCNPAYRYGVKISKMNAERRLCTETIAEFISYAVGCMFGRFSIDEPGLILANQGEKLQDYLDRIPEPKFMPDEDNIIPVLGQEWFIDDISARFRSFLRVTFGERNLRENLSYIEASIGRDIRDYFVKDFYSDHLKRYKKRPIYWMFSSPNGALSALIYMHRYNNDTISIFLNNYLREFIEKLDGEFKRLEKLTDDSTATQGQRTKALKDAGSVAKQIEELKEWERDVIFPLAQQKIEIDLDDGVKVNYRKFGQALKKIPGLD